MWIKPTWFERYSGIWIDLIQAIIAVLCLGFYYPTFSLDYRCRQLRKRIKKSQKIESYPIKNK